MPESEVIPALLLAALLAGDATPESGPSGTDAYRALGVRPQDVLTSTVVRSNVLPGGVKQVVCIATYLTRKKEEAKAVNVRFGVFEIQGSNLVEVYRRDLGEELGGHVANGDLQLLDLDLDGTTEMVLSYELFRDPTVKERQAEIVLHDGKVLATGWTGTIEYDATRAARTVPEERRDRYAREFDWGKTMRTRGTTIFLTKRVFAVAGDTLSTPRTIEEAFPLRPAPSW